MTEGKNSFAKLHQVFDAQAKIRMLEDRPRAHFVWSDPRREAQFKSMPDRRLYDLPADQLECYTYMNALRSVEPPQWHIVSRPKEHRRCQGQTEAGHLRVQKKWRKRGLMADVREQVMEPIVLRLSSSVVREMIKHYHQAHTSKVIIKGERVHVRFSDLPNIARVFNPHESRPT